MEVGDSRKNYGIQHFIVTCDEGLLPRAGPLPKFFRQFDLSKVEGLLFLKNNKLKIIVSSKNIYFGVTNSAPTQYAYTYVYFQEFRRFI